MKRAVIRSEAVGVLFDRDHSAHENMKMFLQNYTGKLFSVWPEVDRARAQLAFSTCAQLNYLRWVEAGAVHMLSVPDEVLKSFRKYTEKYDQTLSFADYSLFYTASQNKIMDIISYSALPAYWNSHNFNNIAEPFLSGSDHSKTTAAGPVQTDPVMTEE